ncbi:MAG TPA: 2-oxo acid dehydrogenase subunit E2 [Terracidiphilus sp.]|jgi:2-oxoglutarate dehydrogenase E2 component (dihydrolipoamide succinyltransferase)|nr:2-oxo acid dehydrogenase subunit E2 [Terracidiphilus sp.]
MPTDVIMPQMGESIFEGTILRWLKQPGDRVEMDEPLFEISTDKVDAEIPSPAAGVLGEILVPEGATVHVNTVVATVVATGVAAGVATTGGDGTAQAATEVVMPQMGESIFEGTIVKWLKQVGDRVEMDEPLYEISTDKVDAEIPSPTSGVVTEIRFREGETVHINTVVAVIGGVAGTGVAAGQTGTATQSEASAPVAAGQAEAIETGQGQPETVQAGQKIRSSPLVRRMAKEHGIDLAGVHGSGSEGRITKEDMLRCLSQGAAEAQRGAQSAGRNTGQNMGQNIGQVVPLSRMRAIIGQRMVESLAISPHAHTVYRIDMTRVARLRERERAGFEQRHGVKLTYMPFIAAAAVQALRKFPIVNSSLIDGNIHYHASVHLGIAVALEGGLIVPVIREAERRSFVDLARAISDLAGRARNKKLNADEAAGSTFTLTNSGVFGGEYGTPIINQPESAILAIGGLRKEPVVLTDPEGNDTIAIRSMQYYCLGLDHRVIDGADAGKFMLEFKSALENWDRALS